MKDHSRKSTKHRRKQPRNSNRSKHKKSDEMQWRDVAPMSKSERLKMVSFCFLDEKNRKYPVCPNRVEQITCKGLVTARARAVKNGNEYIVAKADKQREVFMCDQAHSRLRDARIITKALKRSSRSNTQRRERRKSRKAKQNPVKKPNPFTLHHLASVGTQIKYSKRIQNEVDV
jgi:hypothetical protein